MYDVTTAKLVCEPLRHKSGVTAVAYSPDGRTVITGSADKSARLWDAATGKPVGEPLRHKYAVTAVAFSPDGRTVLAGSDTVANLWQVPQIPDNPDFVRNWAAVKTGLVVDDQGVVRRLTQDQWLKARTDLDKLRAELPNTDSLR
jgi:WD40 repeat protein